MNKLVKEKMERLDRERSALVKRHRQINVAMRLSGEGVTNLGVWLGREIPDEGVEDEDKMVAYTDFLKARTAFPTELRELTDNQLMVVWRGWQERQRRVVEVETFVGWLGSVVR